MSRSVAEKNDELYWRPLREDDIAIAADVMLKFGIRKSRRDKILESVAAYEMNIKGYDFIFSIIDSSILDQTKDFYWLMEGITLHRHGSTFNWASFVTRSNNGKRIKYVNNLMPDRINIKHDEIHQFCKEIENLLAVISKIGTHEPNGEGPKKRHSLTDSVRLVGKLLNNKEHEILLHFRDFRNYISHSTSAIERSVYRDAILSDCYRTKITMSHNRFSFIDDMFILTEKLIKIFKPIQHQQVDKNSFLNRMQLIQKFRLFRGLYRFSGKYNSTDRKRISPAKNGMFDSLVRADFSMNDIGFWISDGRFISIPRRWYPKLMVASSIELSNWIVAEDGMAIEWPSLDLKISLAEILSGRAAPGVVK